MSLLNLLIILAVFGVLLYLFNRFVTMIDPTVKQIINWVAIGFLIIWLAFRVFHLDSYVDQIRVENVTHPVTQVGGWNV